MLASNRLKSGVCGLCWPLRLQRDRNFFRNLFNIFVFFSNENEVVEIFAVILYRIHRRPYHVLLFFLRPLIRIYEYIPTYVYLYTAYKDKQRQNTYPTMYAAIDKFALVALVALLFVANISAAPAKKSEYWYLDIIRVMTIYTYLDYKVPNTWRSEYGFRVPSI